MPGTRLQAKHQAGEETDSENPGITVLSATEDIPEGVNGRVWALLQQIEKNTAAASKRIDALEEDVESITKSVKDLTDAVSAMKDTVGFLNNRLERAERWNRKLKKELTEVQGHSMAENLIFSLDGQNYRESEGEDCTALIRTFLTNVLGIRAADSFFIPVAHRLGPRRAGGNPRQVIARFPVAKEMKIVLDNTTRLKGTRHFISKQLPAALRERQQFALDTFKQARADPSNRAKMVREKLFIKGQLQSQFLPTKLPRCSPDQTSEVDVADGPVVDDQAGSTFAGFTARVNSLEQVRAVRDQLIRRPEVAASSDVMYAFRIRGTRGIVQNFDSEFDYGVGLNLLRWMQREDLVNVVCVATRTCSPGYKHIGDKRFQIVSQLCGEAMKALT